LPHGFFYAALLFDRLVAQKHRALPAAYVTVVGGIVTSEAELPTADAIPLQLQA